MLKSEELVMLLAYAAYLPIDEVSLKARRLREAGLFVRETRSPSSPRATPRHLANLVVMLLSDAPASSARRTINLAEAMIVRSADLQRLIARNETLPDRLAVLRQSGHTFLDAIEALILAAKDSTDKDLDLGRKHLSARHAYRSFTVEFDRSSFVASIELGFEKAEPCLLEYSIAEGERAKFGDGYRVTEGFQRINKATASFFANIGIGLNHKDGEPWQFSFGSRENLDLPSTPLTHKKSKPAQ
jgi:hypothetical protein